jgi:hypothetical protein
VPLADLCQPFSVLDLHYDDYDVIRASSPSPPVLVIDNGEWFALGISRSPSLGSAQPSSARLGSLSLSLSLFCVVSRPDVTRSPSPSRFTSHNVCSVCRLLSVPQRLELRSHSSV